MGLSSLILNQKQIINPSTGTQRFEDSDIADMQRSEICAEYQYLLEKQVRKLENGKTDIKVDQEECKVNVHTTGRLRKHFSSITNSDIRCYFIARVNCVKHLMNPSILSWDWSRRYWSDNKKVNIQSECEWFNSA